MPGSAATRPSRPATTPYARVSAEGAVVTLQTDRREVMAALPVEDTFGTPGVQHACGHHRRQGAKAGLRLGPQHARADEEQHTLSGAKIVHDRIVERGRPRRRGHG